MTVYVHCEYILFGGITKSGFIAKQHLNPFREAQVTVKRDRLIPVGFTLFAMTDDGSLICAYETKAGEAAQKAIVTRADGEVCRYALIDPAEVRRFADVLGHIREASGKTQTELGKLLLRGRRTWQSWEYGKQAPSVETQVTVVRELYKRLEIVGNDSILG